MKTESKAKRRERWIRRNRRHEMSDEDAKVVNSIISKVTGIPVDAIDRVDIGWCFTKDFDPGPQLNETEEE